MIEDIKKNLIDLLNNNYKFVKNTRGNEYNTYDDFKKRFIDANSELDVLQAFSEVLNLISVNEVAGFFWLVTSYNIGMYKVVPNVLPILRKVEIKEKLLAHLLSKINTWPDNVFDCYSNKDKKIIMDEVLDLGISISDRFRNIMTS